MQTLLAFLVVSSVCLAQTVNPYPAATHLVPGGSTGVPNLQTNLAGPATTTGAVSVSSLNLTAATLNALVAQCWTGTGFSGGFVTGDLTALACSITARSVSTVTVTFASSSNVVVVLNASGGTGTNGTNGTPGTNGAITTLQVNGTGVTTPATTNIQTGATPNSGLTVTPTNPSAGNVEFNLTGTPQIPLTSGVTGTLPVTSGGTGVTAKQGNGTKVQLSTGSTVTGDCVMYDANGNTVDAGAACGTGGGGLGSVTLSGTPTAGQAPVATDSTHATWQTVSGSGLTNPTVTAGTGGLTANLAASKDTSSPTKYVLPSTPGSCGSGIATGTVASGSTTVLQSTHGQVYTGIADNAVTAGHFILGYATTPGRFADSGFATRASISSATSICGYATSSATTGGTFSMVWDGPGFGTAVTGAYSQAVTAVSSIAITHNLGTSQPWVTCFDGSGNVLGGTTAATQITNVVANSINIATVTFSGTTTGTCVVSTGSMGPPGTPASVSVGTPVTLSPGSPATVTNTGTSNAPVFVFGIPQGVAGAPHTISFSITATGFINNINPFGNFSCSINRWTVTGLASGSLTAALYAHAGSANTVPVVNNSTDLISASAPITVSASQTGAGDSTAVSTWTTARAAYDGFALNVTAFTGFNGSANLTVFCQ